MKKQVIILSIIISVSVLINYVPQSFAENYWRSPILKWDHRPTICALDPSDSRFPNLSDKMLSETRNAILDWELKLNNNNLGHNPWSIPLMEIPLSKSNTFDKTKCDITMNFKNKPDYVDPNFYETGVTNFKDFPKVSVTIYYQGADFNIQRTATEYVPMITYNDYFATDPQLKSTIRHEIGHALGLGHYVVGNDELNRITTLGTEDSPSIMVENGLIGVGITHFDITLIDISEIKSIYGTNGFPITSKQIQKQMPVQNSIPAKIVNSTQQSNSSTTVVIQSHLPSWIKNTVRWWSHSQLSDDEFYKTMGYLVKQGILKMPTTSSNSGSSHNVPAWIRSNADLWASSQITDYEFLRGIEYLISTGIINFK